MLAAHPLEAGGDIRTVQEPPGRAGVSATMIGTHVLRQGPLGVRSPADLLAPPSAPAGETFALHPTSAGACGKDVAGCTPGACIAHRLTP